MRNTLAMTALAALVMAPVVAPAPAFAQRSHHHYDSRYDRNYHGRNSYRHRCSGGNGAVGTIAGGAGGALAGNALGGGTLGTIAGGVGGALLGRHLDKAHTRSRRGC